MRNIDMADSRYVAALIRHRALIAKGIDLELRDSNTIGDKYSDASWGLCSNGVENWPDAEDHLWPDDFTRRNRVAPKYRQTGQLCPFDTQQVPDGQFFQPGEPSGCFYRCMLFGRKQQDRPTREEAIRLYDAMIAERGAA